MTNSERRDRELAYISDAGTHSEMVECQKKLKILNMLDRWENQKIAQALKDVIPDSKDAFVVLPFYCEYGTHIKLGKNFFANYNCVMLDVAKITIGNNCMFGPNVYLYTAGHPIFPDTRNSGYEYGKAISICDNCWLGGNTTVVGGINIGKNVVIGAGSVVTKDMPDNVVAAGNPCKVIREITEADRRYLYKKELIDDEVWSIISSH